MVAILDKGWEASGVDGRQRRSQRGERRPRAVPPRGAGGARWIPWPVYPKASGFPPSPCTRGGSGGGEHIHGEVGDGAGNGEEETSELRLVRRAALEAAANQGRPAQPGFAHHDLEFFPTAADDGPSVPDGEKYE